LQQPSRHTHIVGLRALLLPLFVSNRQKRSCVLIDHSIVVRILSRSLGKLITARNTQMQLLLHAPSFRDNVATHSNPHAAQLSSSAINAPHHSPGRAICCAAALAHRTCFPNVQKCNLVRGAVEKLRSVTPAREHQPARADERCRHAHAAPYALPAWLVCTRLMPSLPATAPCNSANTLHLMIT